MKKRIARRLGEIRYTPRQIAPIAGHVTLKEMDTHRVLGLEVQIPRRDSGIAAAQN